MLCDQVRAIPEVTFAIWGYGPKSGITDVSEHLKVVFGWQARTTGDGIVPFTERGGSVCAMYPVLVDFWKRNSDNSVLKKWILDIIQGAEKVYTLYGTPVRIRFTLSYQKAYSSVDSDCSNKAAPQ